jgi:pseudouridine synthase
MMTPRSASERTVVILYHKPPNVVTSHSNNDAAPAASGEQSRRTVYDNIYTLDGFAGDQKGSFAEITGVSSKLHAIGRLDADTSGLLLLTNDGGLVHHVTNPVANGSDQCITKTYEAVIMGKYHNNSTELLKIREKGVDIGARYGGMTQPAKDLQVLGHPTAKSTLVSISIAEGKNRQVRRMFHGINSGVMRLKRTHIGSTLNLGDLGEGEWRLLTDIEIVECLGWKPRNIEVLSPRPSESQPRRKNARRRKRV